MSKWIVAFIAIVVLAGAGFGGYRIYQYRQWKVAYGSALDAFKRAYDYRDAGTLLYDPRLRDFETAKDALERLPVMTEDAVLSKENLRICANELETYRRMAQVNSDSASLGAKPDLDTEHSAEHEAGSCIREAIRTGDIP